MRSTRGWLTPIALLSLALSSHASADCEKDWLPGSGAGGFDLSVRAFTHWDPDGAGPADPVLVAAGDFTTASGVIAKRVAFWTGDAWLKLGAGLNATVHSLAVYNGDLIAGGAFTRSGLLTLNHVARWDGDSWEPLGGGVDGTVYSLSRVRRPTDRRRQL